MVLNVNQYMELIEQMKTGESVIVPEFFNMIVFVAPLIVNGDGCSMFLRFEGDDQEMIKLAATTRTQLMRYIGQEGYSVKGEEFYSSETTQRSYLKNAGENPDKLPKILPKKVEDALRTHLKHTKCGLTGWVACFNQPLNLKSLADLRERAKTTSELNGKRKNAKKLPFPVWADLYRGYYDSLETKRPFLCVPIRSNKKVLGALRIATKRSHNEKYFNKNDCKNLQKFADTIGAFIDDQGILSKKNSQKSLYYLRINAAKDREVLLSQIAEMVSHVLVKKSCCSIFIEDEEKTGLFWLEMVKADLSVGLYKKYLDFYRKTKGSREDDALAYKAGQGKTGLTIETREILRGYLDEKEVLREKENGKKIPLPNTKASHKKNCELPVDEAKWICIVPILDINNAKVVQGVIRVVSKDEISEHHGAMLGSFAQQIASILYEVRHREDITKLFHDVIETFGSENPDKENEKNILTKACQIIDSDAASIFRLKEIENKKGKEEEKANIKKYEKTVTVFKPDKVPNTQENRNFNNFESSSIYYEVDVNEPGKKAKGRTGYVLKTGSYLNLSDDKDENQLPDDYGNHAEASDNACELLDHGPILIVPISDNRTEKNVQGAIRFVRRKHSKKGGFTRNDLITAQLLAQNLFLIIQTIQTQKDTNNKLKQANSAKEEWIAQRDLILSESLTTLLQNKYSEKKDPVSKIISDFLKGYEENNSSFDFHKLAQQTILDLWKNSEICSENTNQGQLGSLYFYLQNYEKMLYELQHYRDHFVHQLVVYLLGKTIIDICKIKLDLNAWLLASTFHDIAYPISKESSVFDNFIGACFRTKQNGTVKFDLSDLLYGDASLLSELDTLAVWIGDLYSLKNDSKEQKDLKKSLLENFLRGDHGVLSALTLLKHVDPNKKQKKFIKDATVAVALHNIAAKIYDITNIKLDFKKAGITILLLICDNLQEWGRGKDLFSGRVKHDVVALEDFTINTEKKPLKVNSILHVNSDDQEKAKYIHKNLVSIFRTFTSDGPQFQIKVKNLGNEGIVKSKPKKR